jgi:hypothetical protein
VPSIGDKKNFQSFTMLYRKPHYLAEFVCAPQFFKIPKGLCAHTVLKKSFQLREYGGMTDQWRIENNLDGSGCGLNEVLCRYLPGGSEEKQENRQSV